MDNDTEFLEKIKKAIPKYEKTLANLTKQEEKFQKIPTILDSIQERKRKIQTAIHDLKLTVSVYDPPRPTLPAYTAPAPRISKSQASQVADKANDELTDSEKLDKILKNQNRTRDILISFGIGFGAGFLANIAFYLTVNVNNGP